MKTFRVLGLLLSYPRPGWLRHLDDCAAMLERENILPKKHLQAVSKLIGHLRTADIYSLQEEYVATFDRGRSHSLHLFEHVHGESRDRGQAMVNLLAAYEEKGLFMESAELPDYLPVFLEFLSLCPVGEALDLLGEPIDIVATLAARLRKRESPYAVLLEALVALSRARPDRRRIDAALARQAEDESLEALDREWEEAAAFAAPPGQPGCGDCAAGAPGPSIKITP